MSVQPVISSIDNNHNNTLNKKIRLRQDGGIQVNTTDTDVYSSKSNKRASKVSFTGGPNPIVSLMDFIEAGGYAASFIIQDGLGFIAPRVGKGLLRGGEEKKDGNGNPILDEDGNPKRKLNWAFARKEALRELITGPSAFLIPMGMLAVIKKYFGSGNNVKLNYIDAFQNPFIQVLKDYKDSRKSFLVPVSKEAFYRETLKNALDITINSQLPEAEKMTKAEIADVAKRFAAKQYNIECIQADKSLSKKERKAKLQELGSLENDFMQLMKNKVGGTVDETVILFKASNDNVKGGGFSEFVKAMNDYFGDALKNTKESLKKSSIPEDIENAVKHFTNKRMGSRVVTNLGIFALVSAFYTQIPKLYNMGLKSNPALTNSDSAKNASQKPIEEKNETVTKKNVTFTGVSSMLEKAGSNVLNHNFSKSISDIFELNGPIMSGTAMTALLYGFCIPSRLLDAQDKYDHKEIGVRDFTAFTALLFAAKAISRIFSDGFTKLTGLALNKKNMEGRNVFQKVIDYLNPNDKRHSVLSSQQLNSKYTNIDKYRGGIDGFVEFIEGSGGNIKKALAKDKNVKSIVEKIVQDYNGKTYETVSAKEIKEALSSANKNADNLINDLYDCFRTNISDYKDGLNGYIDFVERSGRKVKDVFGKNRKLKATIEELLKDTCGKSLNDVTIDELKDALKNKQSDTEFMSKIGKTLKLDNGLLNKAKTCNSAFGFLSTLVLVPGMIIWLTNFCEKMTERDIKKDKLAKEALKQRTLSFNANSLSMSGFLGKSVN